jgi:hypothetical protein
MSIDLSKFQASIIESGVFSLSPLVGERREETAQGETITAPTRCEGNK